MKKRLIILFLFSVVAYAQTEVSGNISNNTILNLDASLYIITDEFKIMTEIGRNIHRNLQIGV